MANQHTAGAIPTFELRHRLQLSIEHAGLTPGDMARDLQVHRNTVSNYLHGKHVPRSVLIAWAVRTGVSRHWLETGIEPDGGDDDPSTSWYGDRPRLRCLWIAA